MFRQVLRRSCTTYPQHLPVLLVRPNSNRFPVGLHQDTDDLGIPLRPTWSVDELLSSYQKPTITPSTLKHIHDLSALIPPEEGTEAHAKLTSEMENLVKLVEAVKVVNVYDAENSDQIPDGRIWAEDVGVELSESASEEGGSEIGGRALLCHAPRTSPKGLYLVESDRSK